MYPINLDIKGRFCAVVGGGPIALRKVRSLLQAGARVLLIAPVLTVDLAKLAATGQIVWQAKKYESGDLKGFFIVICATNDPAVNAQAALASDQKNAFLCVHRFWETPLRTGDRRYYDNCLYFFAYLALSGNYRIY